MDKTQGELQSLLARLLLVEISGVLRGNREITLETVLNALEDVKADVGDLLND